MPLLVQIPDNRIGQAVDGSVFACRSAARIVTQVRVERDGQDDW